MALTYTPAPQIGAPCPDFSLLGVDGKTYSLKSFQEAKVLAVMFICNHCPYVKAIEDRLIQLASEMQPQGVQFVAICSNDAQSHPEDSYENLRQRALEKKYPFPYLYDETQQTARQFGAVCTPDFFVYDAHRLLAYRGRLDDSWKDPQLVTQQELKTAIQELLKDRLPSEVQKPSMGCSIKWKT